MAESAEEVVAGVSTALEHLKLVQQIILNPDIVTDIL